MFIGRDTFLLEGVSFYLYYYLLSGALETYMVVIQCAFMYSECKTKMIFSKISGVFVEKVYLYSLNFSKLKANERKLYHNDYHD